MNLFENVYQQGRRRRLKEGIVIEALPEKEDLVMKFLDYLGVVNLTDDIENVCIDYED
jgi:hypothetical protein